FQGDKSIAEYRALAEIVDTFDFETISVYQDLQFQPPWPALMQFAELTSRPLVGPAVVNPYLTHPILIAGHLATIDELSRGRAYLGVGRGAFLDAIGVQQPKPLVAIRECVELVQRFLTGDDAAYEGELFQASATTRLRFSIPGRSLPTLIGGWGQRTLALAGELADMAKVGGSANPLSVPVFRERINDGARDGRQSSEAVRLMLGAVTVVDRDSRLAESIARRTAAMYVAVTAKLDPTFELEPSEREAFDSAMNRGDEAAAGKALSTDTLRRFCTYGTPAEIIAHMEELFAAGVDIFEFGTPHGSDEREAIRLLGQEVMPYFES
ncbi:MAG: LLM class flavin-dependent oxidoreductase, partial [Gaiellaceae bacterium]